MLALPRKISFALNFHPDAEAIWFKAEPDRSFVELLTAVDALAKRSTLCHLVVCVQQASAAEIEQLLRHGADEVLFQKAIVAEPQILMKAWIGLQMHQKKIAELKSCAKLGQEAAQKKSEFIVWLSHEIRTPMNGVLGMLELLEKSRLNPEQVEIIEVIERSGQRVIDLVSEILDVSRLEAGKMVAEHQQFGLRRLLADCHGLYAPDAQRRGLLLNERVDPAVPDLLIGDERKLSQILGNLISNAVKYTSAGTIVVSVKLESLLDNDCRIRMEVLDTGYGIAQEELPRLFAPFEQTQSSKLSRSRSSGIGLNLTKNLVELLGGEIAVQSQLGKGSCFRVSMPFRLDTHGLTEKPELHPPSVATPVKQSESEFITPLQDEIGTQQFHSLQQEISHPSSQETRRPVLQPALTMASKASQSAKVLVVDDDPINLKVADKQLRRCGIDVTLAASALEALLLVEKKTFDLILVDCHMPVMDGFQLMQALRESPRVDASTPVVALTGLAGEDDRSQALRRGFNDYLCKPSCLEDIRDLLGRWLRARPEISDGSDNFDLK